ncbi:MAG: hypothetical protein IJ809_06485 [Clostridia bacterium]|nr:hypothetical protein [Clostridia bacterium]
MKTISKKEFLEMIKPFYEEYISSPSDEAYGRLVDLVNMEVKYFIQQDEKLKVVVMPSLNMDYIDAAAFMSGRKFELDYFANVIDFNIYLTLKDFIKKSFTLRSIITEE